MVFLLFLFIFVFEVVFDDVVPFFLVFPLGEFRLVCFVRAILVLLVVEALALLALALALFDDDDDDGDSSMIIGSAG